MWYNFAMDEAKWYDVNEKSAGEGRLLFSWYLYKIFGEKVLLLISFLVTFVSFITNSDVRGYSKKYFSVIYEYFGDKKLKPSFINSFRHVLSYANSLVFKLEAFGDTLNPEKIIFADSDKASELYEKIRQKKGLVFIFNHIGNIEIMRSILSNDKKLHPKSVCAFMEEDHCRIFRNFMKKIEKENDRIKIYPLEEIDLSTMSEIDDNLKEGGILFMAGDRISSKNPDKSVEMNLFNKKIQIPIGAFKIAKILKSDIYFVTCLKEKNVFKIYLEDNSGKTEEELRENFVSFMEKMIKISPYQFYHFYDIFKDVKE